MHAPPVQVPPQEHNAATYVSSPGQGYPSTTHQPIDGYPGTPQYPAQPPYPSLETVAPSTYTTQAPPPRKSNTGAIILVLLVVVVTLVGTTLFFIANAGGFKQAPPPVPTTAQTEPTQAPTEEATRAPSPTPSPTPGTNEAITQGSHIVEQYFAYINMKDYRSAYNLWYNPRDKYEDFAKGFKHTVRDDVTIVSVEPQSPEVAKVNITLVAHQDKGKPHSYDGFYLVQKIADSDWRIVNAQLNQTDGDEED
ncbi:hypothetical protein [Thermosporothrix hazakensis]|uniref:hypothetical protein n=1 Tax=Thermosporothrix hazakensis TaxID=644383 RepID=UPI001B87D8B0|nr:hypothetical protein [Thermosporothrix hazakensis]